LKKFINLQRRALREDPECVKLLQDLANQFDKGSEAQRGFAGFLKATFDDDKSPRSPEAPQLAVLSSTMRRKRRAKHSESVVLSSAESSGALFEVPLPAPLPGAVPSKASKRLGLVEESQPTIDQTPLPLPATVASKASKRLGLAEDKSDSDQISARSSSKNIKLDRIESSSSQPDILSPKASRMLGLGDGDPEPQMSSKAEKILGLKKHGSSPSLSVSDGGSRRGSKSARSQKSSTSSSNELSSSQQIPPPPPPELSSNDAAPPVLPSKASLLLGLNDAAPKVPEAESKTKESKKESSESDDRHFSDLLFDYDAEEIADALMRTYYYSDVVVLCWNYHSLLFCRD
jgi:hypothetical protein